MPNIIELTKEITKTETAAKVMVRNFDGSQSRDDKSIPSLQVALMLPDTGELYSVIKLSDAFAQTIMDMVEKEIIKISEYAGEQKPYDTTVKP